MVNPIELIKQELCERYSLVPEQIKLELNIDSLEVETAKQILADYEHGPSHHYWAEDNQGGHTHAKGGFHWVSVWAKKEEKKELPEWDTLPLLR